MEGYAWYLRSFGGDHVLCMDYGEARKQKAGREELKNMKNTLQVWGDSKLAEYFLFDVQLRRDIYFIGYVFTVFLTLSDTFC